MDALSAYDGFNTCDYTGASTTSVTMCRSQLADNLGVGTEALIIPRQTHSANVRVIESIPVSPEIVEGVDGLVTTLHGVALVIHTADCVPVVMADPRKGIIAAIHSGWRGTKADITGNALNIMMRLGADVSDIVVAMGPCICQNCFETGQEVAAEFDLRYISYNYGDKPHINLSAIIRDRLIDSGVIPENISMPPACSRCDHHLYFSARRLGINSGRTATVIIQESHDAETHQ